MIAALYVDPRGPYFGRPDIDPWDEARDARTYAGPWPVIAHPPCERWCQLAPLIEAKHGIRAGADNGCFAAALASVRTWGGVLEHPANTRAFKAFGIPHPVPGGWQMCMDGGWVCHVEQGRYGHRAKKATWLYVYGATHLPAFDFSTNDETAAIPRFECPIGPGNERNPTATVERMGKQERRRTPLAFIEILVDLASSIPIRMQAGAG